MTVDRSRLLARLRSMFAEELGEQAAALNDDLLALERAPADVERLRSVFRVFHTLKGAARAADVPTVESFCHAVEGLLVGARDGGTPLTAGQLTMLFAASDALADAARRLRDGVELSDLPLDAILAGMTVSPGAPAASRPAAAAPVASMSSTAPLERAPADVPADVPTGVPTGVTSAVDARSPAAPADELPVPAAASAEPIRVSAAKLDAMLGITGDVAEVAAELTAHAAAAEALARSASRLDRVFKRTVRADRGRGTIAPAVARGGPARGGPARNAPAKDAADPIRVVTADAAALARQLRGDARNLTRAAGFLADRVRELRLRPLADVTEALPRVIRDLGVELGKDVGLVIVGADVEADRAVLAGLGDAILHLVRNAVDHGIETPDLRVEHGKPARATVTITASLVGDRLRIEVADDGQGLDTDGVRAALRRHGRPAPHEPAALAQALLAGGLSTRSEATAISGRGVGLDAVRAIVERLGGTVALSWETDRGTRFVLETPITLAVLRALIVRVDQSRFAIPTGAVERVLRLPSDHVRQLDGRPMYAPGTGAPIPVAPLARLLGPPLAESELDGRALAVILAVGGRRRMLLVDELLEERELVVRPLEQAGAAAAARYTGASADAASVVLVLNPTFLVGTTGDGGRGAADPLLRPATARPAARRIVVADDSITTRTLEESVLSAAGYDVTTAADGAQAWQLVQDGRADLVVSDVEMPRMDGFTLCETIRASDRFRTLPLILVTSLDRPEHRARGLEAGADAYVTKSSFDQDELLQTIAQLLGTPR
jgi:two-component system chemotaxis sensor kinase CheA